MEPWNKILNKSITSAEDLAKFYKINISEISKIINKYPMRINHYYNSLIINKANPLKDPIGIQAFPDKSELNDPICMTDPLGEEDLSPVDNLVHKYPDRALFLISKECPMYCRFCTRKRKVGTNKMNINDKTIEKGLDYLRKTPQIREVLLSGGDPLLLSDEKLGNILNKIKAIKSIEVIRIGTRVPCTLPMRITEKLATVLKKHHPIYINTHFNHPLEITSESSKACAILADAGIPLGCQTVLLKGVNDDIETIRQLMTSLLRIRVKPYYLFQTDLTKGTNHFRTTTSKGLEIIRGLIGKTSGMAIPKFALDAPGGKGKIILSPDYIINSGDELIFKNYCGELCHYPEIDY